METSTRRILKRGIDYILLKEPIKDEVGNIIFNAIALKDLECAFTQGWDKENARIPAYSECYIDNNLAYKEYHLYWMSTED